MALAILKLLLLQGLTVTVVVAALALQLPEIPMALPG